MAIFTRPDSPWWWLWLETATGKRRKEKTKIRVGKTPPARRASKLLAETLYHQRMTELATDIHHLPASTRSDIGFCDWADWWALHKLPHHRGQDRERQILLTLKKGFRGVALAAITIERVSEWVTMRRAQIAARTVNREVDVLKSLMRDAIPTHMSKSPLVGLRRLPVVVPKRRLLTPDDEQKLLPQFMVDDRAIFLMGLDALLRLSDILDFRREDDHGQTLYVRDPKDPTQSRPFHVPVSKRLRAALDAVPTSDSPYYFPRRRQSVTEDDRRRVIRSMLSDACRRADLPYGRNGGIVFHWATRRTGASRMIQRGVDIKTVQAVGNWKRPDVVLDIYAEATTEDMRRAVEAVSFDSRPVPDSGEIALKHS